MEILKNIADKVFLSQQKGKLEKELARLEEQIKITKKFPEYGTSEDENAQEVEKFQENLGLQKNLKNLIKDTKEAIKRIEKGKYGVCVDCNELIEQGRLKIYPSASLCASCATKKYKK
jgi:RNA polymerase-binding transcription factor DksA